MKALVLVSGGLDSLLAARIIKDQGIEVIPLKFTTPFHQIRINSNQYSGKSFAGFVKIHLGQDLVSVSIEKEFLGLLLKPKHGFGAYMNPCIDCKILMLIKARRLMSELGADFVVTGEVLGQRPMSQHKRALCAIEEDSGLNGLLLRPLSAINLKPTIPEERGWVDRNRLLSISGRSRSSQIRLAQELGISGYPNASGGCLLTDRQFSLRLKDLLCYGEVNLKNISLLKVGRHFRLGPQAKLIVGRNEAENKYLEDKAEINDLLFTPDEDTAGPTCLGVGSFKEEDIGISAQIARGYSDLSENDIKIACRRIPDKDVRYLSAPSVKKESLAGLLI